MFLATLPLKDPCGQPPRPPRQQPPFPIPQSYCCPHTNPSRPRAFACVVPCLECSSCGWLSMRSSGLSRNVTPSETFPDHPPSPKSRPLLTPPMTPHPFSKALPGSEYSGEHREHGPSSPFTSGGSPANSFCPQGRPDPSPLSRLLNTHALLELCLKLAVPPPHDPGRHWSD